MQLCTLYENGSLLLVASMQPTKGKAFNWEILLKCDRREPWRVGQCRLLYKTTSWQTSFTKIWFLKKNLFLQTVSLKPGPVSEIPPLLDPTFAFICICPSLPFAADMNIVLSSVLKICLISSHVWLLWKAIGRESLEDDFFQKTFQLLSRLEAQFNSQKHLSAEL